MHRSLIVTTAVLACTWSMPVAAAPVLLSVAPDSWTLEVTDGTSNTIQFGASTAIELCVPSGSVPATITDGTSNTIQFTEQVGLTLTWSSRQTITDGTSNTIGFPESTCFTGITDPTPIVDGTSNTIGFGEDPIDLRGETFDVCFTNVALSTITDGTSNTIQFSERACYRDVGIGDVQASVPAPAVAGLWAAAVLTSLWRGRRRQQ